MAKKTRKFKTEVQQLLNLVIHSLYSKSEIFLRELISNSSDAIDRARLEALTNKDLQKQDEHWKIKIHVDKEAKTLTVSDNGVGMDAEELDRNIGTIANSGTRKYLEELQEKNEQPSAELIGQFGVGFYSSFMAADKVTVITRRAGSDEPALKWISTGAGSYTIEETEREEHGTDVILHLAEGKEEFLEEWRIRQIVKQYSDYIAFPIVMDVVRKKPAEEEGGEETETVEEETLNSMKSIWKKSRSEVSDEEYKEFYKHVSHDYVDPLDTIHYAAEGVTEFRALLYIPSHASHDILLRQENRGIHLYVRNVFITDDCEDLLPQYLRFVRGVVDSSDLPLNVSREMLQDHAIIRRMRKNLVNKVLNSLAEMKKERREDYETFYRQFGQVLKEGMHLDQENREKIQELLLFSTSETKEEELVSLQEIADRMPGDQDAFYYLVGEQRQAVANSPLLEGLRKRGFEVLLMVDPIDQWVADSMPDFAGKPFKDISRGELDLDQEGEESETKDQETGGDLEEKTKTFQGVLDSVRSHLQDDIKEVRLTNRLTDSACCLVADPEAMSANIERIMRAMNQDVPKSKRILELNPDHPVVQKMQAMQESDPKDDKLGEYAELLYDQALLAEGSPLPNPARFARRVSDLMARAGYSG